MTSIADFDFTAAPLSEAVITASLAIRSDFPAEEVRKQLSALVTEARTEISSDLAADLQVEQLIELFWGRWGFGGASGVYRLSDMLWLDNVLKSRQGTAASLGVIFLHIADKLDLPLFPVIFPTQLILRAEWVDEDMWLINPFDGETLDEHTLEVWLKGNIGPVAELYDDDLQEAEPLMVLRKMLDTLKSALMDEKQMEMALHVSQVLVQMDPEDPYEIRDRGLIFAQLECDHVALSDLTYFVEQCPEDPISEMIKVQIHSIEQKQITLH
ncbi:invasion regulator SirB1 [Erwinia persicina]|uniref:invasion regulator SirB1 n=1 Tax=Erwinia persicina TaxID=55211 RepID=UPI00177E2FEB|nr:invasion regulator SirB1 [Erwinia persicina]MBD8161864.1 tetratricopeptide repeat-containing protein [Erwinia persicina]MBD8212693.1 tetratricopeptide repeat-containing protein [Erwinia persicina]